MTHLVSVVIPTRDSGKTIETCLKSVSAQTYHNVEVVVVDAHSTDNTIETAHEYGAKIFETGARRSQARNIGAEKAVGDLILFLDADMQLNTTVIERGVDRIGDHCDAVIIPETSVGESFWARCKTLEKKCYIGDETIEGVRFLRKSVLESIGGYDNELEAGEDWDLSQRIVKAGYRIGRINAFIIHHEGRLSLRDTVIKKHYYGKALERYQEKHPEESKRQLKLIRPAFVRNRKRLAKDPIHALGMFFMKTCEFVAGWIGSLEG